MSLFKFPRDKNLRRQWTRQIERTRAKWTAYKKCQVYERTLELIEDEANAEARGHTYNIS